MTKLPRQECLEWAFGNLLDNVVRGKVAEFLVAKALGVASGQRREWDFADLRFEGRAIEVKSSAYLQSWHQSKPSRISFDVAERRWAWDSETNEWLESPEPRRFADLYVFCLFVERDRGRANPLDTDQWETYIASTSELKRVLGSQKNVGISKIRSFCLRSSYPDLSRTVAKLLLAERPHAASTATTSRCP